MEITSIEVNGVEFVPATGIKSLKADLAASDATVKRGRDALNVWVDNANYWKEKWDAECAKRQEAQERVASLAELANYRLNEVFCLEKQVASLQERNDWQVRTITMLVDEQLRLQDQVASLNKRNDTQAATITNLSKENAALKEQLVFYQEGTIQQAGQIMGLSQEINNLKAQLDSCKDQTEQVDALCQENRRLHEHVREFKDIAAAYARKAEALQQTVKQAKDQAVAEWILSHVHQSYMKEMEKFFGRD
jgi:chromosome segregation ATPase